VLGGFSQGGAIALFTGTRHSERLAGLIGLSCYPVLARTFATERSAANAKTPIFLAHGTFDPMVDIGLGEDLRRLLEDAGSRIEWHTYPMPHSVCPEEIASLGDWLRRVL
jgi:phospholipase/carboxylesterase